jgi:predicted transport protein
MLIMLAPRHGNTWGQKLVMQWCLVRGNGDDAEGVLIMGDIKLFRTGTDGVTELAGTSVALEKSLQTFIEQHMEELLGIQFLASEHSTGKTHGGRIDSLGVDENGCPVILEYKRATNENVINQGLFYLDWLMDHKAEFQWLVMEKCGKDLAEKVEWTSPRLICIAGDFTKYDEHAVQQINRNIELIRYRRYGDELILFELMNATSVSIDTVESDPARVKQGTNSYTTVSEYLEKADEKLTDLFEQLKAELLALGDDVQVKTLKFYFAFKRIKNFACVEVHPKGNYVSIYLKVNPEMVQIENGFSRDVRSIGHFGTGDLELTLRNAEDIEKAKPLILKSYESS